MRKYFFFLPFILVACVNNGGDGSTDTGSALPAATHVPEITSFALSPDTTTYMDGDGTIVFTAPGTTPMLQLHQLNRRLFDKMLNDVLIA